MIDFRQKLLVVKSKKMSLIYEYDDKGTTNQGPPQTLTKKSETTHYEANFKILLNNELLFRKTQICILILLLLYLDRYRQSVRSTSLACLAE